MPCSQLGLLTAGVQLKARGRGHPASTRGPLPPHASGASIPEGKAEEQGTPRGGKGPSTGLAGAWGSAEAGTAPRPGGGGGGGRAPLSTSGPEAKAKATLPAVRRRNGLARITLLLPLSLETDDAPAVPHRDWARSTGAIKSSGAGARPLREGRGAGPGGHGAGTAGAGRAGRPGAGGR